MKKIRIFNLILNTILLSFCFSCTEGWLEEKRDLALVIPTTLKDMRSLMNNVVLQNDYIGMAEVSADDYYVTPDIWNTLPEKERNIYSWNTQIYPDLTAVQEWNESYRQVFYCNLALVGLQNIKPLSNELGQYNEIKGEALFYRAKAFYNIAQLFAPPYDKSIESEPGIPLKLFSDINIQTTRSTIGEVYETILTDYTLAIKLLPKTSSINTRPTKAAGHAALARYYLSMRLYNKALIQADSALQLKSSLMDYSKLDSNANYPIMAFNSEVILHSTLSPLYRNFSNAYGAIDSNLYKSYNAMDYRKSVNSKFNANGTIGFKGSYTGSVQLFNGTTTGEMLLIRAECLARSGKSNEALIDLNTLLEKRMKIGFKMKELLEKDILPTILEERRKELLRRGLRWTDLRRLNFETENKVALKRSIVDEIYELPPNDRRYTLPIPDYVISISNIKQNIRK